MKRLAFAAAVVSAALTLAACNNNQDAVQNAEMNQPDSDQLNELANQAMDAANSEAALNAQNQAFQQQNATSDNAVNPAEADEQNVSGM